MMVLQIFLKQIIIMVLQLSSKFKPNWNDATHFSGASNFYKLNWNDASDLYKTNFYDGASNFNKPNWNGASFD